MSTVPRIAPSGPRPRGRWVRAAACALLAGLAPAVGAAQALDPALVRQDIATVRDKYLARDLAFSPPARGQAQAMLAAMERDADTMTRAEWVVRLAQVGALADNAHSGMRRDRSQGTPAARLPLRFVWLGDDLVVARAHGAHSDLAGARVLGVEGRSLAAFYLGTKVLLGGSDAGRRHWLNGWIETAGIVHALGLAASPDALRLSLRLRDGRTVERMIAMSTATAPAVDLPRLLSPQPIADEVGWTAAIAPGDAPLALRDADQPFRIAALPGNDALYVQLRTNEDAEGHPIADFLRDVDTRIAADAPRHLVVDLRFDTGGNLLTTLAFARRLAASVPGNTYLLVGPYTFSAGIITAAAIAQGGGDRVVVVGETLGDRAHFWSEGGLIALASGPYAMRYSDGQFNLDNGCSGERACMDDLYPINVNGASLAADLHAPLDADAFLAGRDPAMEAVFTALAAQAADSGSQPPVP